MTCSMGGGFEPQNRTNMRDGHNHLGVSPPSFFLLHPVPSGLPAKLGWGKESSCVEHLLYARG